MRRLYSGTIFATAAIALLAACADQAAPVGPAREPAPTPRLSAAAASLTNICHKTAGTKGYLLIAVAQSAVPAHLAHGDGFVGGPVPNQPDMVFDTHCAPVPATSGLTFAMVSAEGGHTCGVTTGGAAYCWGFNSFGELGDGTVSPRTSPVAVQGGLTFAAVSAGGGYTCGVTTSGAAYCWGENDNGQLGDGTTTGRTTPVLVLGGLTFAAVSAGGAHTCGVTAAGAAHCWGSNLFGELGDGTTTVRTSPAAVLGGLAFHAVSASALYHTCGVTAGGAAYCWGYNNGGQLGDGTMTDRTSPVPVSGGLTFAAVSAGGGHTCGVTTGGVAYCWGLNILGQLGDGTTIGRTSPVHVTGGLSFAAVSASGGFHTCGVTTGGAAYCWGNDDHGQLGDGATITIPVVGPGAVLGGLTFAAVSGAYYHTCGVTTAGAAYCWGRNDGGQLGDGSTTDRLTPVPVVP